MACLEITRIERSTNGVSLTWNSRKGREYSVEFGSKLEGAAWIEVADGLLGLEDATTFVDDDAGRAGLPPSPRRRFELKLELLSNLRTRRNAESLLGNAPGCLVSAFQA